MTLDHSESTLFDVVIVGAGPAGSIAAITLARAGRRVAIIDQSEFPRDKPCGDALSSQALSSLVSLGLGKVTDLGRVIRTVSVSSPDIAEEAVHRFPGSGGFDPICIPRRRLDAFLLDAAQGLGASFFVGRVCRLVDVEGSEGMAAAAELSGPVCGTRLIRARAFIAADGATSILRRQSSGIRLEQAAPKMFALRRYYRTSEPVAPVFVVRLPPASTPGAFWGYSWMFPPSDDLINVGISTTYFGASSNVDLKTKLDDWFRELISSDGYLGSGNTVEPVGGIGGAPIPIGAGPFNRWPKNVRFVGDAARVADPVSGEGIAAAIQSGMDAAEELHLLLDQKPSVDSRKTTLRFFPRIGQDMGLIVRRPSAILESAGNGSVRRNGRPSNHLLAEILGELAWSVVSRPVLSDLPILRAVATHDSVVSQFVSGVYERLLDELRTEFPFALDQIHACFHEGGGPSISVTAGAIAAAVGAENSQMTAVALSCELVNSSARIFDFVDDRCADGSAAAGNALAVMIADYALSQGLRVVADLDSADVALIFKAGRMVYQSLGVGESNQDPSSDDLDVRAHAIAHQAGELYACTASIATRSVESSLERTRWTEFARRTGVAFSLADHFEARFESRLEHLRRSRPRAAELDAWLAECTNAVNAARAALDGIDSPRSEPTALIEFADARCRRLFSK